MVTIHTRPEAPLEPAVEATLTTLFADYREIYVKSTFTAGLSGSHVLRVRGVQPDGSAELSAVAKVDQAARIEQEWHAYQSCVARRLPGLATIHAAPTFVDHDGERWGGLWYPLVGDDTFDVESLHAFLQTTDSAEACALLEGQLFRQMDALWRQSDMRVEVSLGGTYDDVLPPNAVVRPLPVAAGSLSAIDLTPATARAHRLTSAEIVSLRGFRVARLWPQQQRVLLDGAGDSAERYRLLLTDVADLDAFRVGERLLEPLVGVVVETRQQTLTAQVAQAIDTRVEISAERVTTPTQAIALPNPLHALPTLLGHTLANARFGCIHGDLNLENVLITRQTRSVHLIDFVNARRDHVIRDLVHLEVALVTHLLPLALASAELPPDAVVDFYERLHCAERMPDRVTPPAGLEKPFALLTTLRQTARAYLAELSNWDEYYAGLCVYLIGGLRYTSLDAVAGAKEVAFWASAEVLKLLDAKPDCTQYDAPQLPSWYDIPGNLNHFFRWSEATPHDRESWGGMLIYSIKVLTDRLNPLFVAAFFLNVGLWAVTAWLLTPIMQWPHPDPQQRLIVCVQFAAGLLVIPLVVSLFVKADYQKRFDLSTWRDRWVLWLLKWAGAQVGLTAFALIPLGVSLLLYDLAGWVVQNEVWWAISAVPALMCVVAASRIPSNRREMFGERLQMHAADRLMLPIFLAIGPALAAFIYFEHALVTSRLFGVCIVIALGIVIWKSLRDQKAQQA